MSDLCAHAYVGHDGAGVSYWMQQVQQKSVSNKVRITPEPPQYTTTETTATHWHVAMM